MKKWFFGEKRFPTPDVGLDEPNVSHPLLYFHVMSMNMYASVI